MDESINVKNFPHTLRNHSIINSNTQKKALEKLSQDVTFGLLLPAVRSFARPIRANQHAMFLFDVTQITSNALETQSSLDRINFHMTFMAYLEPDFRSKEPFRARQNTNIGAM